MRAADGLILTDGMEVKTPPHLSTALALTIRAGDAITVHGLKAAQLQLVQALSVTNDATGKSVIDFGPDHAGPPSPVSQTAERQAVSGRIRMLLHGPLGDINGVLLEDGTVLEFRRPRCLDLTRCSRPVRRLQRAESSASTLQAKSSKSTAIGASPEHLQSIP